MYRRATLNTGIFLFGFTDHAMRPGIMSFA